MSQASKGCVNMRVDDSGTKEALSQVSRDAKKASEQINIVC